MCSITFSATAEAQRSSAAVRHGMKLPRDLSGERLIRVLCRDWEYRRMGQVGSHVSLETQTPSRQRIVVPDHKTLRVGTLNAIVRAVAAHKVVSKEKILESL